MSLRRLFAPKVRPLVLGHRGLPLHVQENTLDGFLAALQRGADGVELDVHITLDNHLVCCHDDDTERLCGVPGKITERTWAQVTQLRVRRHLDPGDGTVRDYGVERPLVRLDEVFDALPPEAIINVELKPSEPSWGERHVGTRVAELIRDKGQQNRAFVTGFDFFKLHALEAAVPGIHSGYAYDDDFADYLPAWIDRLPELRPVFGTNRTSYINALAEANAVGKHIGSTVVGIERSLIDEDTIRKFHDHNMAVGTYTIFPLDRRNVKGIAMPAAVEEAEARTLAALGVDWFETDDPERLLKVLG